jgi:hypothetical protein
MLIELNHSHMKKFRIVYQFNHSKMGFQNSITIEAKDEIKALIEAKEKVATTYHMQPIKKFTFGDPIQLL